jgi:hypothetical protein
MKGKTWAVTLKRIIGYMSIMLFVLVTIGLILVSETHQDKAYVIIMLIGLVTTMPWMIGMWE